MTYKVVLVHSEEGYAAYAPGLPGCATQGATEQEAMDNTHNAILEYLEVARETGNGRQSLKWPSEKCRLPSRCCSRHSPPARVRAFEKAGFRIARQGKHIIMTTANGRSPFLATTRSTRSQWELL